MKIISDFRDYYDSLQSQSDPIYIRKTTESQIKLPFKYMRWSVVTRDRGTCFELNATIVGFCGEVKVAFDNPYLFSIDKIRSRHPDFNHVKESKFEYSHINMSDVYVVGFNPPTSFTKEFMHLFSHDCPIWTISGKGQAHRDNTYTLTKNPRLNKVGFVNHCDVQQTFQKIEMYLSNLAFPDKKIPVICDDDKILTHGFDEFSFRKGKSLAKKSSH